MLCRIAPHLVAHFWWKAAGIDADVDTRSGKLGRVVLFYETFDLVELWRGLRIQRVDRRGDLRNFSWVVLAVDDGLKLGLALFFPIVGAQAIFVLALLY